MPKGKCLLLVPNKMPVYLKSCNSSSTKRSCIRRKKFPLPILGPLSSEMLYYRPAWWLPMCFGAQSLYACYTTGISKTPPTDPCGQVGSRLKKGCFFPRFLAFVCGFLEENIVVVLHYDLKCIFHDN